MKKPTNEIHALVDEGFIQKFNANLRKFIMVERLKYPQIPGNLYGEKYLVLPLGIAKNADAIPDTVAWETSDENIVKYFVKIVDKNTYNIVASEEIDAFGTGNEDFSSCLKMEFYMKLQ